MSVLHTRRRKDLIPIFEEAGDVVKEGAQVLHPRRRLRPSRRQHAGPNAPAPGGRGEVPGHGEPALVSSPLQPSASVLCKLGSIARHLEELRTAVDGGQAFDLAATESLLDDPELVEWMAAMDGLALLPLKR